MTNRSAKYLALRRTKYASLAASLRSSWDRNMVSKHPISVQEWWGNRIKEFNPDAWGFK